MKWFDKYLSYLSDEDKILLSYFTEDEWTNEFPPWFLASRPTKITLSESVKFYKLFIDTGKWNKGESVMSKVNIGDTVYFANGCENLTEGKVVHIFKHFGKEQYVIEYNAVIDAALEVRDWNTISLKPEGPLHLWEMAAELFKKYKERIDV